MLNRITIMGRLTRDPELRHTQAGVPVASFSIACDRDFKDKATDERTTDQRWRTCGSGRRRRVWPAGNFSPNFVDFSGDDELPF